MDRIAACLKVWRSDTRAVAAIEFAMTFPLLLALAAGAFELSRAVSASRQLTTLTNSMANMLATNTTATVTYIDLHYAANSTMLIFPQILSNSHAKNIAWGADVTISMAGVIFTPTVTGCTNSCTYKANIVWTGGAEKRACGTHPSSVPNGSAFSTTTLPAGMFTPIANPQGGYLPPNFAVVIDVSYAWTPLVFSNFFGTITLARSAYVNPRYVTEIKYSAINGDDGFGKECPGY